MEVSELIKKVRKLELKTRKQSKDLFTGNYTSTFKGKGISFHGVRAYSYGDDVRTIDWNVTSRSQEPYIKEFEEERELTFILLVDISLSNYFGSQETTKRDIVNEVAATLSFSALNNNDKVGVIFFSEKVEKYIPPKKGKAHILTILRELINIEPSRTTTNVGEAILFVHNTIKKKSTVFVLSDFIESGDFEKELIISRTKHNFYALQFYDKAEENFPDLGLVELYNPEKLSYEWVDTSSSQFRNHMKMKVQENLKKHKTIFKKLGGEYCAINVQEPYIHKVAELFKK
ncbi:MAG: DUF58 domain-containing protein [Chitinophagales bacterium]|jgi:uncharacterized protein (DUF58 family)|nr:DUF58 domain-containing protein [Sphingobacteriales bacterium]